MKICILSIVNIKHMSLISMYTTFLEERGVDYDIIYIDKYNEIEEINAKNVYKFTLNIKRDWGKLRKVKEYWKFKKYAQGIMKENKYDFIIVWRTETALMFGNFLAKQMSNKYCLNIRDYCYEKNILVFNKIKKIIDNAKFTTISSKGYEVFLPQNDYVKVHSYNEQVLKNCKPKHKFKDREEPINICFIGYVRFFDIDKQLIDSLGNDSRYKIQFFGEGSEYLERYALDKGIKNVEFIKGFKVEETGRLLEKADVINNLYGFNNISLDTAISIKYYYALHLHLPILVFKNTYMEELTNSIGIGFSLDGDFTSLADDFYNWYHSLDREAFSKSCEAEKEKIDFSTKNFNLLLMDTFKDGVKINDL